MKSMPSSEFRKAYATLSEPVLVTVLGHAIGQWTPFQGQPVAETAPDRGFGRPTPAPKPGKRGT